MEAVTILIVEDEAVLGMDLAYRLEQLGYLTVGPVDNGPDALLAFAQHPIDLVLLDIHIRGDWDGIETGMRMRQIRRVPLIFLTAMTDDPTIQRARQVGPSAYMIKPFSDLNLRIAIDLAVDTMMPALPESRPVDEAPEEPQARAGAEPGRGEIIMLSRNHVFVKQNYRFIKFPLADIVYLQSEGNYTDIITDSQKYTLRLVLNRVLEKMHTHPLARTGIVRVHRSFAVNVRRVTTFSEHEVQLDAHTIPVGRSYRSELLKGVMDA